ncbi:MAG: RsmD family RNA methyltransferase [Candidatus Bathyarchaeota archaeon]|nr:RsmD family RNA methyltransferase [Candidatus Bathyarchaeota archaeon]
MSRKLPPILTADTANALIEGKTIISTDLGLTETTVKQTNQGVIFETGEFIDHETLGKVAQKKNAAFFISEEGVFQVAVAGKHFYKLVPTAGAPTLEIDGIRMHRTKDTTPDIDTQTKLQIIGLHGGKVLDTCMGLGYTSIEALNNGAEVIVTIEIEPSVFRIAQMNPWSSDLFSNQAIHKMLGDSFTVINGLPDEFFDYVIHDPPRHRKAGNLYGKEFYEKLFKVLKPGGSLFHYTGEPRSKYRGVRLQQGVMNRLSEVGFHGMEYHPVVMGVTCIKGTG